MTDRTNVITVTRDNLDWINTHVPGSSKQKRLEEMLKVYQGAQKEYDDIVAVLEKGLAGEDEGEDVAILKYELLHKILGIESAPRWSS